MNFDDIQNAFQFVSMAPRYTNNAILRLDNGRIYYLSGLGDSDQLPDDIDDHKFVEIPHKNYLDLGKQLVFHFASARLPDDLPQIKKIFSRKGAYTRYKCLLVKKGLLDEWSRFEEQQTKSALKKWCVENEVTFTS